jgi:hypothetical protein
MYEIVKKKKQKKKKLKKQKRLTSNAFSSSESYWRMHSKKMRQGKSREKDVNKGNGLRC